MRLHLVLLSTVLVLALFATGCHQRDAINTSNQEERQEAPELTVTPPPASLSNFYPPKAEQPVFLFKMLDLGTSFGTIMANLLEPDIDRAKSSFQRFRTEYTEVSKMVPEWEEDYPVAPVDEFEKALGSGDRAKIMTATQHLSKVCHDCHVRDIASVKFKYHWPDFGNTSATDPITGEEVNFDQLKQYLNMNYAGITANVYGKQTVRARKHMKEFRARFGALKKTCGTCHEGPMRYFTDQSVDAMIDKLDQTLAAPSIDAKAVQNLMMGIGRESCLKCHSVHMPSAMAKYQWSEHKE